MNFLSETEIESSPPNPRWNSCPIHNGHMGRAEEAIEGFVDH